MKNINSALWKKKKIIGLLYYCHANDVRWTLRRMFEVYFMCDAMPGMEITTCDCNDQCARYGCSTCTTADDAELGIIKTSKMIFLLYIILEVSLRVYTKFGVDS